MSSAMTLMLAALGISLTQKNKHGKSTLCCRLVWRLDAYLSTCSTRHARTIAGTGRPLRKNLSRHTSHDHVHLQLQTVYDKTVRATRNSGQVCGDDFDIEHSTKQSRARQANLSLEHQTEGHKSPNESEESCVAMVIRSKIST